MEENLLRWLGNELDAEEADTLRLQGYNLVRRLILGVGHLACTTLGRPLELLLGHLIVILVVTESALCDLDIGLTTIVIREHVLHILLEIKHGRLAWCSIK